MKRAAIVLFAVMMAIMGCYNIEKEIKMAEQGDPISQYQLGVKYYLGDKVERDYEQAVKWLQLSANQGESAAQDFLSHLYYHGQGVEQDYAESYKLLTSAATLGHLEAQYRLGNLYYLGYLPVGSPTYREAAQWYLKAAWRGLPQAQLAVGRMYLNGQGVTQDVFEGYVWLLLASESVEHKGLLIERISTDLLEGNLKTAIKSLTSAQRNLARTEADKRKKRIEASSKEDNW